MLLVPKLQRRMGLFKYSMTIGMEQAKAKVVVVDVAEVLELPARAPTEANAFGVRVAKAEDWLTANGLAEAAVTWFGPSNGWSNETLDEISRWAAQRKADAAAATDGGAA